MRSFLDAQCQAVGVRLVGWRCAETPEVQMPVGCACSLRWVVGADCQGADAVFLRDRAVFVVRPDLMWEQPLPLSSRLFGCDIAMPWCVSGHGSHVHVVWFACSVCAAVHPHKL